MDFNYDKSQKNFVKSLVINFKKSQAKQKGNSKKIKSIKFCRKFSVDSLYKSLNKTEYQSEICLHIMLEL